MKLVTNLVAWKNISFCYIGYKTFLNATTLFRHATMLQPFWDCFTKQSQKDNTEHIKIENQNFNKVFVPHNCHSTLFVGHLI